jgi:hypothetical protein
MTFVESGPTPEQIEAMLPKIREERHRGQQKGGMHAERREKEVFRHRHAHRCVLGKRVYRE